MYSIRYDYAIIGGDHRQTYLAGLLCKQPSCVCCYALPTQIPNPLLIDRRLVKASSFTEACRHSRNIICPTPLTKDGKAIRLSIPKEVISCKQLLSCLTPQQHFFAGCIPKQFALALKEKQIPYTDFLTEKSFLAENSLATAKGALCEAMLHTPFTLPDSHCAVLGFGNCGNAITQLLAGLHCYVTVFSRCSSERKKATAITKYTAPLAALSEQIHTFDLIFNTIPAPIVGQKILRYMRCDAFLLEIASSPGGVDQLAAKQLHRNLLLCTNLPGKYAPLSCAKALQKEIATVLSKTTSSYC